MINLKLTIFYHRNLSEGVKDEIRSFYKQFTTRYCSFLLRTSKTTSHILISQIVREVRVYPKIGIEWSVRNLLYKVKKKEFLKIKILRKCILYQ